MKRNQLKTALTIILAAVIALLPAYASAEELPATPTQISYSGAGASGNASNGATITLPAETPMNATINVSASNPDIAGFAGSTSVTLVNGAGTATFTCSAPADETNTYTDVSVSVSFTVAAGEMVISAQDKITEYTGVDHGIEVSVTGTTHYSVYYSSAGALTDTNYTTGSATSPKFKAAGTNTTVYYYVKYTGSGNFTNKSGSAALRIDPAQILITAKDVTVDYDAAVHGGSGFLVTGNLATGDHIADGSVVIAGSSKSAGQYPLVPSGAQIRNSSNADNSSSYNIRYANGKLTIEALPVTLAWYTDSTFTKPYASDSFLYTGKEQVIYAKVANALTGDSVFVTKYDTIKTNTAILAGKYNATAKEISNTNYTLVGGKNTTLAWVIGKSPISVALPANAAKIIKTYDSTAKVVSDTLQLEVLGLAEGEIATASGEWVYDSAAPGENKTVTVKNISIEYITAKKDNYSYAATPIVTQGAINKAILIIKIDDISIREGQSLPPLTYTITGFAPGEDESVLGGALNLTSAFIEGESKPGYYDIVFEGAAFTSDNYDIQYEEGVITLLNEDGSLPKEAASLGKVIPFIIVGVVLVGGFLGNYFISKSKKNSKGKKKSPAKKAGKEKTKASKGVSQGTRRIDKVEDIKDEEIAENPEEESYDENYGDEGYEEGEYYDEGYSDEDYSDLSDDLYYDEEEDVN